MPGTSRSHSVFQVPQIALKEEGARLACGARRLKGKVGCLRKPVAGYSVLATSTIL